MKLLTLALLLILVSTCWAMNRKDLMNEFRRQNQEHTLQQGITEEDEDETGAHPTISNHHSIPREKYNSGGGSSPFPGP